jgi:hypothetical protein
MVQNPKMLMKKIKNLEKKKPKNKLNILKKKKRKPKPTCSFKKKWFKKKKSFDGFSKNPSKKRQTEKNKDLKKRLQKIKKPKH